MGSRVDRHHIPWFSIRTFNLATTVVVFCSFFGLFLFSCIPSATARIMCFLPEGFQNVWQLEGLAASTPASSPRPQLARPLKEVTKDSNSHLLFCFVYWRLFHHPSLAWEKVLVSEIWISRSEVSSSLKLSFPTSSVLRAPDWLEWWRQQKSNFVK